MSDQPIEATEPQQPADAPVEGAPAEPQEPAQPKPTETVDFWKQKAREQESRAKANADAAKRLKEIEDRDLSELQKAQRDRDELAQRLEQTQRDAVRSRVALEKGLPADIAATLNGSSEEELAAHADRLLAWRGNVPPVTPRPDLSQGARPSTPQADADAEYERFFPSPNRA